MGAELKDLLGIIGGWKVLGRRISGANALDRLVQDGLPYGALETLRNSLPPRIAAQLENLVASRTTLQRRRRTGVLPAEEGERLVRFARIWVLAAYVLESVPAAEQFLLDPHALIDHEPPVTLLRSEVGARRVEDILRQLEYSLPV